MSELIIKDKNERVGLLSLNSPEKLNALSEEMIETLSEGLKSFGSDSNIKAIIIFQLLFLKIISN